MPTMIFVRKDTAINLDHVVKIQLRCADENTKPEDTVRMDIEYSTDKLDQIETTYEEAQTALYMTQLCSGFLPADDEYSLAEEEIDRYCVRCKHFDADDEDPCDHCVHNLDDDGEPAGQDDNFDPDEGTGPED